MDNNERLVKLEVQVQNLENDVSNIKDLTSAVKENVLETKHMREDINKMDNRVKSIEEKPGKRFDNIIGQVISIIVAGVVGFFLAKFGI